ncbi:MAG: hypothetical protein P9L96_01635 [Candidatus Gygaella obscura]|nr:hypothetical protein [Candidatus Gygaella obscura]
MKSQKDNFFKNALIISILIHVVIFLSMPSIDVERKKIKVKKPLKIKYIKIVPKKIFKEHTLVKSRKSPESKPINTNNKNIKPTMLESKKLDVSKTKLSKPLKSIDNISSLTKNVSLAEIENIQQNLPGYKDYYHSIRGKIKQAAYDNYNVSDIGEVHIYFIVNKDGTLVDFRIKDSFSSNSASLRNIAILSLQDASPFPRFPKKLNTEILSFNVIISFESQ